MGDNRSERESSKFQITGKISHNNDPHIDILILKAFYAYRVITHHGKNEQNTRHRKKSSSPVHKGGKNLRYKLSTLHVSKN